MSVIQAHRTLSESESVIKSNENFVGMGFWNIGNELKHIRDNKTYKEQAYVSFEEYVESRLGYSRRHAYRLIEISEKYSVTSMSQIGHLGITKLGHLAKLEEPKREEFINQNKVDEMTARELQKAIKQTKELEQEKEHLERQLQAEKDKPAKVIKERVEVPPHDYESLKVSTRIKQKEINELKEKLDRFQKDSEEYNRLKEQIEFLHKEKDDLGRRIESATELSGLAVKIDNFLKTELAPIRYSRCFERMDSEVARDNLLEIIESVETWCYEIKQLIPEEYRRVTVIK
jgi:ParB family chromosome partitioning protein